MALPADAKLFVDEQATQATSSTRIFMTPPLQHGYLYSYTLRAEVVRDGRALNATKQVTVRPGEIVRVAFPELQRAGPAIGNP